MVVARGKKWWRRYQGRPEFEEGGGGLSTIVKESHGFGKEISMGVVTSCIK